MLPERISRLLSAYVDGELEGQQRQAVLRLLRRSSEARDLLRDLQTDADQLRGLPRQTLAPDFSQHVLQIIASRKARSVRSAALKVGSYIPAWLGLASAAAVLLVVGLGAYVYFVAADRQRQHERLAAVLPSEPDLPPKLDNLLTGVPVPAPDKPNSPERLGLPAPETEPPPSSFAAATRIVSAKPPTDPKQLPLGSPVGDDNTSLKDPPVSLGLVFNLRELDQENQKQQLYEQLQKGISQRIDLRCTDIAAGMERLQAAFKPQGIRFVIDQDAGAVIKLGVKTDSALALYLEEATPQEMLTIFQRLSSDDRKAEMKRRGPARFESLTINAMSRDDRQKLSRLLGIDVAQLDAPRPKGPAGVDVRKPLSKTTEEQVLQSLKGQGTLRSELAKPALKTLDRAALVVMYTPDRPRPASAEMKQFLDNRQERHAGAVPILLVLHSSKR